MGSKLIVYWDANAFLGVLNRDFDPQEVADADSLWTAATQGKVLIATSTLTNAEVIFMKGTPKLDPAKRQYVSNFFRQDFIIQYPVTRLISELARDVVWDTTIKPKDAVHVATAAYHKVRIFHTFDKPALLNAGSVVVNGFSVEMRKPKWQDQREMDLPNTLVGSLLDTER